jgi:predicted nucleotidyltransferase
VEKKSSAFVEDALKRLNRYVSWLKKNFNVKLILLFGSFTKDNWITSLSDLDLLVVAEGLSRNPAENYERLKLDGLIEPLAYDPKSFLETIENLGSFVVLDALEEGKTIYADKDYLRRVSKVFRKVKERRSLRKTAEGWRFKPSS